MDLTPQFQQFINSTLTALGLVVVIVIGFQLIRFFDEQSQLSDSDE
jgi:uncharacterized membrane-anchored protein YhcB (DUF1043 family)